MNFTILSALSIFLYFIIYIFRKKISEKLKVVDKPNEIRKIHKIPTPKTGSYSIALLFFFYIIFNLIYKKFDQNINPLIIGSLLIFIVGFVDDKYKLNALTKIITISLITFSLCVSTDYLIVNKFYIYSYDFFFKLENFSILFTILCILCLVNAVNLSDGINGLATGIITFWFIYINKIYDAELYFLFYPVLINLILIFIHNYRGKHFLGDSGSLMLSGFIAFFIIYLHNKNIDIPKHYNSAEMILIIFIIPVLDMIRLFFTRLMNRKNPGVGDNNHFHHYLIKRMSIFQALILYFALINIPILISLYSSLNKFIIIGITILIYFFLIFLYKPIQKLN